MAVQGSLKTITIPELFSLLHQLRKTGVLTLVTESDERGFLFYKGNLVYATTRDGTRRMGSYLVRLGLITQQDLEDCITSPTSGELYFGQKLVEAGKLERGDIHAAVQAQILDILGDALTWSSGAFQFDDGEMPFAVPDGTLSTHSIILEATRRADERSWTKSVFPELGAVLTHETSTSREGLSESQDHALSLADGQRSVEEILFASGLSERATVSALKELVDKGVLKASHAQASLALVSGVEDLRGLPVAPNVPGKLFSILNGDSQKVPRIAEVLAVDPTLAAKALRAVTLKREEIPRGELSLRHIAEALGGFELRSILLPEAIRGLFFSRPAVFWKESWEHSVFCAQICQKIAELTEYPFPEEAYLAGLLHNLGLFILYHNDPQRYRSIVAESTAEEVDIETLEEQSFGISHSRLGGVQAEKWRFPRTIAQAIRGHHSVDPNAGNPLPNMLSVACGLAEECGLRVGFVPTTIQQYKGAIKKLNLNHKKIASLVSQVSRAVVTPVT